MSRARPTPDKVRLTRLSEQRITGGLLSTGEVASLRSVGLHPVSEVIGAVANSVRPQGFYGSAPPLRMGAAAGGARSQDITYRGSVGNQYLVTPTYTSSTAPVGMGVPPTITALKSGYRTALTRLITEAKAVGADGVVGVRVTRTVTHNNGSELWSFLAVGSAVRSTGATRAPTPFTTDLSGTQVAAALGSGWIPVALLIVPCMAVKWIDLASRFQRRRLSANGEVEALTDLVNTCRHQARKDFATAARTTHADAAVLTSMDLELDDERPEPTATALVTITGTGLSRFDARHPHTSTLAIMPLSRNDGP